MCPDITMCEGTDCPAKKECYRYKATPDRWQSWFAEVPYDHKLKDCDEFMPLRTQYVDGNKKVGDKDATIRSKN